jgi:hypothetical protein
MKLDRAPKNTNGKRTVAGFGLNTVKAKPAQKTQNNGKPVTMEARIDVGFGNSLFVRGEGHGLSWDQGIPLTCVDASTWTWSGQAEDKVKFKLLLNDAVWSKGEDLVVAPGDKLEVAPTF